MRILSLLIILFFFPVQADDYSTEITNSINAGNWKKAEALTLDAIEKYPDKEWLHHSLVNTYIQLQKQEKAVEKAREIQKKWPDSEKSLKTLAMALTALAGKYLTENNYQSALPICEEAYKISDKESVYIWYGIALKQSKDFAKSIQIFEEGLKKYPNHKSLKSNYSFALYSYGIDLLEKKNPQEAEEYLEKAFSENPKDSIYYQWFVAVRDQGKLTKAIEMLDIGQKKFPKYPKFSEALPYLRFLQYKEFAKEKDWENLKKLIERTVKALDIRLAFDANYYYYRIIVAGLQEIGDLPFFESIYKKLFTMYKNDENVYDSYGFTLFLLHRLNSPSQKAIKNKAIEFRRKAIQIYESKHPNRKKILNVASPLKGRYMVTADFGGDALTHNGFGNYCYDFMAVDEKGEIRDLSKDGKKNEHYYNFNTPVYAVADGEVSDLLNSEPDNEPGGYAASANYVTIRHKGFSAFYAHLKKDSIVVKIGDSIQKGDLLGYNGNSGMSTESHLHFCLNDENWVSLPFVFKKLKVLRDGKMFSISEPFKKNDIVFFE